MDELVCVEAERGLAGALMLEAARVLPLAVESYGLVVEAFSDAGAREVFGAAVEMEAAGKLGGLDLLTIGEWMRRTGALARAGGELVLEHLVDACQTVAHAEYYADLVRQKWLLRRAVGELKLATVEAREAENGDAFVQGLPERFARMAPGRDDEVSNRELLVEVVNRWEEAAAGGRPAIGFPTPWDRLTEMMCGIEDGMTIIAGRPSAGKSTLEDCISTGLALDGVPVARVQLDMNRKKSLSRPAGLCRIRSLSICTKVRDKPYGNIPPIPALPTISCL